MPKRQRVLLLLEGRDLEIVTRIADHLRCSRAELMRWSLRHYALTGPWSLGATGIREQLVGDEPRMQTGPHFGGN
jgi:hypothetical protein